MKITATFNATTLPLAPFNAESLAWMTSQYAGGRGDVPRMGRYVAPGERVLSLPIVKKPAAGEDTADLDAWITTVNAQLALPGVLVLTSSDGSSATFVTFPSDPLPPRADDMFAFGGEYIATLELRVEPFATKAAGTITEADLETPGSVDLSAMTGEYPTPTTVSVDPGASTAVDMHSVYLALCADAAWTGFVVEATSVAGWDDEVADGGLGVNVVRFADGAGADSGTVPVTDFPPSAYLVLARVKVAAGTLTLDSAYTDPVTSVETHWEWLPVGEVVLPTQRVRGAATCTLALTGSAVGGAGYCHRLAFLPLRWGFLSYHNAGTPAADITTLRAEWEDVYVDDVVDFENILGGGLKCLGGQLIVLTEEAAGTALHHHADVSVAYEPRRNWLG
jgi:hypothetical protein